MPLSILVPMVVLGIGGITILLHLLGMSGGRPLQDEAAARAAWAREVADDPVERVILSQTGRAALIHSASGRGIVWAMGADTVARSLDGATMTASGTTLRIAFPEYDARGVKLTLAEGEAQRWAEEWETAA